MQEMKSLNANETKALNAILEDCDDIEGEYFTRQKDAIKALTKVFGDAKVAGGYFTDLSDKGFLAIDDEDDFYGTGIWVNVD